MRFYNWKEPLLRSPIWLESSYKNGEKLAVHSLWILSVSTVLLLSKSVMSFTRLPSFVRSRLFVSSRLLGSTRSNPLLCSTSVTRTTHFLGYKYLQGYALSSAVTPELNDETKDGNENTRKETGRNGGNSTYPRLALFLQFVGSLAIPIGLYISYRQLYKPEDIEEQKMKSIIEGLKNSKIVTTKEPSPFIHRAHELERLSDKITMDDKETLNTVVIAGPRGCGKTTLVKKFFEQQTGDKVIMTHLDGTDDCIEKLVTQIFRDIGIMTIPSTVLSKEQLLEKGLLQMREEGYPRPTLVVEVNDRVTSRELQTLLVTFKTWGDDLRLMQCVVVLSSSRTALGIQIPINILRGRVHLLGDLTDSEAKMFIKRMFEECDTTVKCEEELIEKAHALIGNRLLHLHTVRTSLKRPKVKSLDIAMKRVKEITARYEDDYASATIDFINMMAKNHLSNVKYNKSKVFTIFQKLQKGEKVVVYDLCDALAVEKHVMIESESKIQPHPFYIHPTTLEVTLGSHFMNSVLDLKTVKFAVEKYPEITLLLTRD